MNIPPVEPAKEGLREKKRRETRQRIAETGLRLFLADGYEETTLDAIAAACGISRRTFFYYFKSKEELLLAWQGAAGDVFAAALLRQSPDQAPVDAVAGALASVMSQYESEDFATIDRLMRSTETLRARKQANYERQEEMLFEALCRLWPRKDRRTALRLVAMVSIGALRLAIEAWCTDGGKRPIGSYLKASFAKLKAEMSG